MTTLAGLYGPLLTDHTGNCLPRAHDFQFSTRKGSRKEVARKPETLACASVNNIPSVLPSTLPLIHSLSHPSTQVSAHLSIHSFFYLTIYSFTQPIIHHPSNNSPPLHPSSHHPVTPLPIHPFTHPYIHCSPPPHTHLSFLYRVIQDLSGTNFVPRTKIDMNKSFISFPLALVML